MPRRRLVGDDVLNTRRGSAAPTGAADARLRVDWPACQARGLCAEVLPELVGLDEWGYPIVAGQVPPALAATARDAVRMCPHSALRLLPG